MGKDNIVSPASDITKNSPVQKSLEDKYLNPNANELAPLVAPFADEAYELVFENRNNAGIVLGKNYDMLSPTENRIGMIDIAAGRVTDKVKIAEAVGAGTYEGATKIVDASQVPKDSKIIEEYAKGIKEKDAARVLIAQRTSIDDILNLKTPKATNSPPGRSAVAIKADAVRIVSRDAACGVKIMVHQDPDGENSVYGDAIGKAGVELIAGGKLEPMVKAESLARSMAEMVSYISKLQTQLLRFYEVQMAFNRQVAAEMDISPFYAQPSIPDPKGLAQLGKTEIDAFINVTQGARNLASEMALFEINVLGIGRPDWSPEKPYAPAKNYETPSFASHHHKLD